MRLGTIVFIFLPTFISNIQNSFGQLPSNEITYFSHIQSILSLHCVECHRDGGMAPFSLETYQDINSRASMVFEVISSGYMPPWRATETNFKFKNQNILSSHEKDLISQWIKNGKKLGDPGKQLDSIKKINFNEGLPKKIFSLKNPYLIPGNNTEQTIFFHIPSGINSFQYIRSIEFVPGKRNLVHHARIMLDTTNNTNGIDGLSANSRESLRFQQKPLADPFLYGWVPGNDFLSFPKGTGKRFYPNSNFILNIHYSPTPIEEYDSSQLIVTFDNNIQKEVKTLTLTEENIVNGPFKLPPEKKSWFVSRSRPLEKGIEILSLMPHMHLLGESFEVSFISPNGSRSTILKIPKWDFQWQRTYFFEKPLYLPKGSLIIAESWYDNTSANLLNPNSPPKLVFNGWGTSDEMMNLIIYFIEH